MNWAHSVTLSAAATAFDRVAGCYDELFTHSMIGQAQRKQVWAKLLAVFPIGDHILELNCGTGEDARFLAQRGRSVIACDASPAMIEIARRHSQYADLDASPAYLNLANEDLALLPRDDLFDGAFSNFSGLNCLADLQPVARNLSLLVKPGGSVLLCLWSRVCLAELIWYVLHNQPKKAIRRLSGKSLARLGGVTISVSYPTVGAICRAFSPWFRLKSHRAVGLFVPPSYAEKWIRKQQKTLARLERVDQFCAEWPILRGLGDHMLLEFVRCNS